MVTEWLRLVFTDGNTKKNQHQKKQAISAVTKIWGKKHRLFRETFTAPSGTRETNVWRSGGVVTQFMISYSTRSTDMFTPGWLETSKDQCKRLTQGTVSTIPQTMCPRTALQLDQEPSYLAGCQRVVHQLVRGWTSAFPRGCASDSPKAFPQGISGLFTRYHLCNMGCLQEICASCLRADISVDK